MFHLHKFKLVGKFTTAFRLKEAIVADMKANRATCINIADFCPSWNDYDIAEFFDYDSIKEEFGNEITIGDKWHIIILSSNVGLANDDEVV
jgi:hypothetical protein